jgi:hypothetical protein
MATWAKLKVYMKLSIVIYNRYNNWPIPKPSIQACPLNDSSTLPPKLAKEEHNPSSPAPFLILK